MITDHNVRAGTVLHFDFKALRGNAPEFYDQHPVVVISPTARQKDRTVIVVPLPSVISNEDNTSAVEIFHREFNACSPTKRTFAVCNLPIAISLKRPALDFYRICTNGPREARFEIRGEDLSRIRAKVVAHFYTDADLRSDVTLHDLVGGRAEARFISIRSGGGRALRTPSVTGGSRNDIWRPLPKAQIGAALKRPAALANRAQRRGLLRSNGPRPENPRPIASAIRIRRGNSRTQGV